MCLALSKLVGSPTVVFTRSQFCHGICYFSTRARISSGAFPWRPSDQMAFLKINSLFGTETDTRQHGEVDNEDRGPPHTILYITIEINAAESSSNETRQSTTRRCATTQSSWRPKHVLLLESCVTEVKIEAQAISGVPLPSSFVFFVFPY